MKVEIVATALMASGAAAFSGPMMMAKPAQQAAPSRAPRQPRPKPDPSTLSQALPWAPKPLIGDGTLVGDRGFDPFGLSKQFDLTWLQSAELKHGRIAMLAALGFIAPEIVHGEGASFLPPEFAHMNGITALFSVPRFGLAQIFLICGLVEIATSFSNYKAEYTFDDGLSKLERESITKGKRAFLAGAAKTQKNVITAQTVEKPAPVKAGDLGFDPLGLADSGTSAKYAEAEVKHGRLAMIGALGMILQAPLTDVGILQQTKEFFSNA